MIKAMQRHSEDTGVQQNGCGCLWNLAVWGASPVPCNPGPCASADGDAADDNKKRIAEAGGISQVIAALHNHTGVGLVQYHGLGALRNLACNGTFIEGVTRVRNGCADITFGRWLGVMVGVGVAPWLAMVANRLEQGGDSTAGWHRCGSDCDAVSRNPRRHPGAGVCGHCKPRTGRHEPARYRQQRRHQAGGERA